MRRSSYTLFCLLLLAACQGSVKQSPAVSQTSPTTDTPTTRIDPAANSTAPAAAPRTDSISGDFDGDGRRETAWLAPPAGVDDNLQECADSSCTAAIRFSNSALPPIPVRMCIGGTPDNLGDLYGDGRDVIGLNPDWFTSCWHGYYTWTYRKGGWFPALDTLSTHCIQWEEPGLPVQKIPGKPGFVRIRYSESDDDGIHVKTAEARLRDVGN